MRKDKNKISKSRCIFQKSLKTLWYNIRWDKIHISIFKFILKNVIPFIICYMFTYNVGMENAELKQGILNKDPDTILAMWLSIVFLFVILRGIIAMFCLFFSDDWY